MLDQSRAQGPRCPDGLITIYSVLSRYNNLTRQKSHSKSMSPAMRETESLVLERKIRHGNYPALNMCVANAATEGRDASNHRLSKKRSSGRIDGLVALVMAIGVAPAAWKAKFDAAALIGWRK
jgi:phage terminase large subunit-like protein